jgi:tRNA(fMet)-specific endonuclease VapC
VSFLLDTDICSAHLKGVQAATSRCLQYAGRLHISVVTLGELITWADRANAPRSRSALLADFLRDVALLEAIEQIARRFGSIRADLLDAGKPVADTDLLIAATALEHCLTLGSRIK